MKFSVKCSNSQVQNSYETEKNKSAKYPPPPKKKVQNTAITKL